MVDARGYHLQVIIIKPSRIAVRGGFSITYGLCREQGDGSARYADAEPQNRPRRYPTLLDLIASLSEDELRSVMTAVLNHVSVLLPAGPQPVMTGPEWGYPELEHDTPSCLKLLLEGISWSLSGFFGEGQPDAKAAPAAISP